MNLNERLQAARREILSNNVAIAWWENEKKNEAVLDEVYKDFKAPIICYPKNMSEEEAIRILNSIGQKIEIRNAELVTDYLLNKLPNED